MLEYNTRRELGILLGEARIQFKLYNRKRMQYIIKRSNHYIEWSPEYRINFYNKETVIWNTWQFYKMKILLIKEAITLM